MKKFLALLVCFALSLTLVACGGGSEAGSGEIDLESEDVLTGTSESYGGTVEVNSAKESYNRLTGETNLANDRANYRPIAISVNNITACLPQKGLSSCDLLFEIETEGGITRTMAIFSDTREVELVGSVRSLRNQFMEIVYPFDPIIVHIGASVFAEAAVAENNFRTIDANVFRSAIWRDLSRKGKYSAEHTYFTSASLIESGIQTTGIRTECDSTVDAFNFVEEGSQTTPTTGTASAVTWDFSTGYDGDFRYNSETAMYEAWQHGKQRYDANNDTNLAFKNVFVVFVPRDIYEGSESYAGGLPKYDYTTGGSAYYFSNGSYEEVTWQKGDYSSVMTFWRADGSELPVNTGRSYIAVVRTENTETLNITA